MKIRMITEYSGPITPVGDFTTSLNSKYAEKHGYDFVVNRNKDRGLYHPSWGKVYLTLEELKKNDVDYVFWLDADALILDYTVKLESLLNYGPIDAYLLTGSDTAGLCMGVYFARNMPWTIQFFETLKFLGRTNFEGIFSAGGAKWEQDVVKMLYFSFINVYKHLSWVPHRVMNSYVDGGFQQGDFVLHAVCLNTEQRLSLLGEAARKAGLLEL